MATQELAILIKARDEATGVLRGVERETRGLSGALSDVGKIATGILAANVVGSAVRGITDAVTSGFAGLAEEQSLLARLDAVLRSTGHAAGLTADELVKMSERFKSLTTFSSEAVLGAENLLLTFTNIRGPVFEQATQAVLDMSVALGQDLKTSAVQLGKALNDPVQGINALRRVGVSFTEEQRRQIQTLVESGQVMDAQRLILQELAREFGGSAQAQAETLGGRMERLKVRFDDLKKEIARGLLPVVEALVSFAEGKLMPVMERAAGAVGRGLGVVGEHVRALAPRLEPLRAQLSALGERLGAAFQAGVGVLRDLAPVVRDWAERLFPALKDAGLSLFEALAGLGPAIADIINAVASAFGGLGSSAEGTGRQSGVLKTILTGLLTVLEAVPPVIQGIAFVLDRAVAPAVRAFARFLREHRAAAMAFAVALGVVAAAIAPIPTAIIAVGLAVGFLRRHWDDIRRHTLAVWGAITRFIGKRLGWLVAIVRTTTQLIANRVETAFKLIRDLVRIFSAALRGDWSGVWNGVKRLFKDAWKGIVREVRLQLQLLRETVLAAMRPLGQQLLNVFAAGVRGALRQVEVAMDAVADVVLGALRALLQPVADAGRAALDAFADAVTRARSTVTAAVAAVTDAVAFIAFALADRLRDAGAGAVRALADAVRGALGLAERAARDLADLVVWPVAAIGSRLRDVGRGAVEALGRALRDAGGLASRAAQEVADLVVWPIAVVGSRLYDAGRAIVRGLWDGIQSLRNWINNRVRDFANSILESVKRGLGKLWPFSPSVAGIDIAVGLVEGLRVGLQRERRTLQAALSGFSADVRLGLAAPAPAPAPAVIVPPVQAGPRYVFVDRIEARLGVREVLEELGL